VSPGPTVSRLCRQPLSRTLSNSFKKPTVSTKFTQRLPTKFILTSSIYLGRKLIAVCENGVIIAGIEGVVIRGQIIPDIIA